jgi:ATP-dependent DNA helicase RecG
LVGWAETAGCGMMKIFAAWERLNYQKPVIDNNNRGYYFKMIFPLEETEQFSHLTMIEKSSISKRDILKLCVKPHSLLEIMEQLNYKHRTYLRSRYIVPLIEIGLLKLTDPEKPRSSKQKYVTTIKRKEYLAKEQD